MVWKEYTLRFSFFISQNKLHFSVLGKQGISHLLTDICHAVIHMNRINFEGKDLGQ